MAPSGHHADITHKTTRANSRKRKLRRRDPGLVRWAEAKCRSNETFTTTLC